MLHGLNTVLCVKYVPRKLEETKNTRNMLVIWELNTGFGNEAVKIVREAHSLLISGSSNSKKAGGAKGWCGSV